jgi:hypothetical protein
MIELSVVEPKFVTERGVEIGTNGEIGAFEEETGFRLVVK